MKTDKRKKYIINEHYFDNIDNEEKAYFLGLICADGHLCIKTNCLIMCLQEEDQHILEKLAGLLVLSEKKPIYTRKIYTQSGEERIHKIITVCSKGISQALQKLGIDNHKTFTLKCPPIIPKLLPHFIRGFYDGDGTFYERRDNKLPDCSWNITSNGNFLSDILEILIKELSLTNVKFVKTLSSHKNIFKLQYGGMRNCYKIYNYLFSDATIYIHRKRNKISNFFSQNIDAATKTNSSKYKYVSFNSTKQMWRGMKFIDGKEFRRHFQTEEEARKYTIS